MRKGIVLTALAAFVYTQLRAQVQVMGTVTDSAGKSLPAVSVTLAKKNGLVLAFSITNSTGAFKINWVGSFIKDSMVADANAIGYKKQSIPVISAMQVANFKLNVSVNKLPNVSVTNSKPMLKREGDTLNYDVASFSNKQDRVIGDVIKKLPGVEVAENGQISYGGKPINRFYIDGDNLLDGRYNIATKAIPNDAVSKIQVLENHQPIKALKDVEKTDAAAMNIVLKDKARLKIMGTGDAALGVPGVYSLTDNAMLFQKQVKFINYIKLNNTGYDLADETINHFGNANTPVTLLSAGGGSPGLLKKRWLFNNAGVVNASDMISLKNEYQLRVNAFYLWDRQFQSSALASTYYLPNDTIRYAEKQDTRAVSNTFNTQFTLSANKKNYYLSNVTVLENTPSQVTAGLQATSNNNISQYLNGTVTNISNSFGFTKKSAAGAVWGASSSISVIHNPATLTVLPGLYAAQFNSNAPYAGLIQQADVPTFATDNAINFSKVWSKFQVHYKIGLNYQTQQLNSLLESQKLNGNKSVVADSFINHLNWDRLQTYAQTGFTYNSGPLNITGSVPFTYQVIKYSGRLVNNQINRLLITPTVYVKYSVGKEASVNLNYNYGDMYGAINQVYDGYIMRGYRDFFSNGTLLNESKSHSISGTYNFKNTLKIFFLTVGAGYVSSTGNTISDSRLSALLQQSRLIPFINVSRNTQAFVTASKYIFPLMTTLGGRVAWQRSHSNQLQNGDLLQMQNDSYTYSASINSKLSQWFNMSYAGTYTRFGSQPAGNAHSSLGASPKVESWRHELSANFVVNENFYFKLGGDNYRYLIASSQDNNYTFVDAAFTWKLNKLKTDIELSLTNLANVEQYSTATVSANSIVESSYRIRPRMALLKFQFRF